MLFDLLTIQPFGRRVEYYKTTAINLDNLVLFSHKIFMDFYFARNKRAVISKYIINKLNFLTFVPYILI